MPVSSDNLNPVTDRPNYYAGQYLLEDDFELEQQYHLDRLRRHHRLLHIAGIVHGLEVSWADRPTNTKLQVTAGTAIDADGRQIVLAEDKKDIPSPANGSILYLRYESSVWSSQAATATEGKNRIKEAPVFEWGTTVPTGAIALARVTTAKGLDVSDRVYSGLRLPSPLNAPGQGLTLRYKGNGKPALGQLELAEFTGNLSITGTLAVTGTSTLTGSLTVNNTVSLKGSSTATGLNVNSDGNVSMGGTLAVTGTSTLTGSLTVNNTVSLKGSSTAIGLSVNSDGNVSMGSTLAVMGTSTLTGSLTVNNTVSLKGSSTTTGLNVTSDGNVGIGTTSPVSKLTINRDIVNDNSFNTYGDAPLTIFERDDNNGGSSPKATRDILNLVREGIAAQAYGNKVSLAIGRYENNATNSRTQLDIKLTDNSFDAHNTVMSLRSNGNVGIGTSTPSEKLEVNGNVKATNAALTGTLSVTQASTLTGNVSMGGTLTVTNSTTLTGSLTVNNTVSLKGSASAMGLSVDANGRVGIGTNDPAATLEVSGTTGTVLQVGVPAIRDENNTANINLAGAIQLREYASDKGAYFQARDDNSNRDIALRIRTQAKGEDKPKIVDNMHLSPNGQVGFGTISPVNDEKIRLDVVGGIRIRNPKDNSQWIDFFFDEFNAFCMYYQGKNGIFVNTDSGQRGR